jgi:hypothetical protein
MYYKLEVAVGMSSIYLKEAYLVEIQINTNTVILLHICSTNANTY